MFCAAKGLSGPCLGWVKADPLAPCRSMPPPLRLVRKNRGVEPLLPIIIMEINRGVELESNARIRTAIIKPDMTDKCAAAGIRSLEARPHQRRAIAPAPPHSARVATRSWG